MPTTAPRAQEQLTTSPRRYTRRGRIATRRRRWAPSRAPMPNNPAAYLLDSTVCGTHCIQFTHGGTWTGYVMLAGQSQLPSDYYYYQRGRKYTFGNCGEGSKGGE
ncbi:hypothetical protein F5Y16DRAFT_373057 [Xylariaceae sp. FL0255]|nr:hypothetical protein F5Y16DRAFT_373057 [Xylariaceae sp. FL0255]